MQKKQHELEELKRQEEIALSAARMKILDRYDQYDDTKSMKYGSVSQLGVTSRMSLPGETIGMNRNIQSTVTMPDPYRHPLSPPVVSRIHLPMDGTHEVPMHMPYNQRRLILRR